MLPENLTCLRNDEIVKFITPGDRLVDELARRLEGVDFEARVHELETEVSSLEEQLDSAPDLNQFEDMEIRVRELEELLKKHNIEVPK